MIEEYRAAMKKYKEKWEKLHEDYTQLRIECSNSKIEHKHELEKRDDHEEQQRKLEKLFENMNNKYDKLIKDFQNYVANERYADSSTA